MDKDPLRPPGMSVSDYLLLLVEHRKKLYPGLISRRGCDPPSAEELEWQELHRKTIVVDGQIAIRRPRGGRYLWLPVYIEGSDVPVCYRRVE